MTTPTITLFTQLEAATDAVVEANKTFIAAVERLAKAEYDVKVAEALQGESEPFREHMTGVAVTSQAYKDKRVIWMDGHCAKEQAELASAQTAKHQAEADLELARDRRSIAKRAVDALLRAGAVE